MSRRKNKKLMVGLGSTLIFSSTAIMGAFGLKSIVDNFTNQTNTLADQINTTSFRNVDQIPDFNQVKDTEIGDWSSMLFDTSKYAKQMHFGSTEKGQTLTPWGWLGVGTPAGNNNKNSYYYPTTVFLTSWNGEILWVNDEFKNVSTGTDYPTILSSPQKHPVYDLKYDWNTDTVFVLRTSSKNGLLDKGQNIKKDAPARIDVLKGSTGQKLLSINSKDLEDFRNTAWKTLNDTNLFYIDGKAQERMNNLYSLDVASSVGIDNRVFLTYKPNFLKLIDEEATKPNHNRRNLIWSHRVLEYWDKLQITFEVNPVAKTWKKVAASFGGDKNNILINEPSSEAWRFKYKNQEYQMGNTSLIANPFNTVSAFGHLITHLFFADDNANIYHLYYANKNTGLSGHDWNDYVGVEKVGDANNQSDVNGVNFSLLNDKEGTTDGGYWGDAIRWDNDIFSTANLIINRNMFDTNSVTFAYPYAATLDHSDEEQIPAFNVASLTIDLTTGKIKPGNANDYKANFLKSTTYDFGKQSYEYWKKNKNSYSNPTEGTSLIYPWPNSTNDANWNLKFNRLISVSPFDNTVIFAGMTPFRSNIDQFRPDKGSEKYASFWVGTNQITKDNKSLMRPFIIGNDSSIGSEIDGTMISGSTKSERLKNLYKKGFTFDLSSLNSIDNSNWSANINIYFAQTAQPKEYVKYKDDKGNLTNGVIPISKIGLLNNPFKDADDEGSGEKYGWTTNITNLYGNQQSWRKYVKMINSEKFSSVIHSRARIEQWIKRSWFNVNYGANTLKNNYSVSPIYKKDDDHATIYQWNKPLNNPIFKTNAGAELLTNWKTGNNGSNYDLLEIKQPFLEVLNKSETDKLFLQLRFSPNSGRANKYKSIITGQYGNDEKNFARLTWKREIAIDMPSVQYFTSWSTHVKATGATSSIDHFAITDNWNEPSGKDVWVDARQSGDRAEFGKSHNAISYNNHRPLRTVLRIKNPITDNNKPDWWNPDAEFFNWYPANSSDLLANETEFKTILHKFVEWKIKNIDLTQELTKTKGLGLANLRIEAGLQFNPTMFDNASTTNVPIYKVSDTKYIAVIEQELNGKKVPKFLIYDDQYNDSRAIYKQEQTSYDQLPTGGFGTAVYEELKKSWDENQLSTMKSSVLEVSADVTFLKNKLVRPSDKFTNPVIKAKYTNVSKNQLKIDLADESIKDWFNSVFNSYNMALNLFVQFEYKLKGQQDWKAFTGNEIKDTANANTGWTFNTNSNEQIEQVRFRLVKSKTQDSFQSPENDFVKWVNYDKNKDFASLVSDPAYVQGTLINFKSSWITSKTISTANNATLDQLQVSDLEKFEQEVLTQVVSGNQNNQELKNVLEFQYAIAGNNPETKDGFVNNISQLLKKYDATDAGIFTLWNGQNNQTNQSAYKIKVKVVVKAQYVKDYVLSENNVEKPNGIETEAKTNIKTKVDLTNYLNWLKTEKIGASKGANPGEMSAVVIPDTTLSQGQQFDKKTFDQMKTILANVGVKFRYKQWDKTTNGWETSWKDNLNDLTKYNVAQPKILLGFEVDSTNFNVSVVNGTTTIDSNWTGLELNLNLPKAVKIDPDKVKQLFTTQNAITGDTHKIIVTQTAEFITKAIEQIITENEGTNQKGLFDNLKTQLKFTFALADSGFKEFNDLDHTVSEWGKNENEKNNNQLRLKIELNDPSKTGEFELLDPKNLEIEIYADNNTTIKKWLFGKQYESEIKNILVQPDSPKNDLKYTYPQVFDEIRQNKATHLKLEWRDATKLPFANQNNDGWKDLADEDLPLDVSDGTIEKIEIRMADKDANDQYLYGPEQEAKRIVQTINFKDLKVLVEVDAAWLKDIAIIEDDSKPIKIDQLTLNLMKEWEQKIFAKIKVKDPQVLKQIQIQYQFIDTNSWKTKDELITQIQSELTKPTNDDRQILQLWDGKQNQGLKIKAKFSLIDATSNIIFVDNNQKPITDQNHLANDTNTKNIYTQVNLINYLDKLTKSEIDVVQASQKDPNSNIVQIQGITLPANDKEGLFKGKTWAQISSALKAKNIEIKFSRDKATWYSAEDINSYDATAGILWMAIENQATNLYVDYLQNKPPVAPQSDNKSQPLFIHLNVQKVLKIERSDFESLIQNPQISGNTKNLELSNNNAIIQSIEQIINKIKEKNKNATGNPDYDRVPLKLQFKLGSSKWFDINGLKNHLASLTSDQDTRVIDAKFIIDGTADEQKKWVLGGQTEFELVSENASNPLKLFIHNQGIYEKLKTVELSGNNLQLSWNWKGLTVDPNKGTITSPDKKGSLKVQYSLDSKAWVDSQITTFPVGTAKLYIQLVLSDENRYEFENKSYLKQPIEIDTSKIKQILNVASNKIETLDLSNNGLLNIEDLAITHFNTWEKQVKDQLTLINNSAGNIDLKKLIQFEYQLDIWSQTTHWADANMFLGELKALQQNHSGGTLGILQLWNNFGGRKVRVRLKLDPNTTQTNNYELQVDGKKAEDVIKIVKTDKIITTVDFRPVYEWLKTIKLSIDRTNNNTFTKMHWEPVSASGSIFDRKSWDEVAKVLTNLNIEVQYRDYSKDDQPKNWVTDYNQLSTFGSNADFEIKLVLKANRAKNIKLKVSDKEEVNGSTTQQPSKEMKVQLKAPKFISLDQTLIDNFKAQKIISGNTKNISADEAIINKLLEDIKKANSNITNVNSAHLKIYFAIGKNPGDDRNKWYEIKQFVQSLKDENLDQSSNQINIRFFVGNNDPANPDFVTDNKIITFKAHTNPEQVNENNPNELPYFINEAQWENNLAKIDVSGSTDALNWNYNNLKYELKNDETVLITNSSANHKGLHLEWTAKADADLNAASATANDTDLEKGWTKIQPSKIAGNIKKLWIRVVAQNGFIYGPKTLNKHKKHEIDLSNIHRIVKLQSSWLTEIVATGNLAKLSLDETKAKKQLIDAKVLPEDEINNLVFEYTIDEKDWFTKDQFEKLILKNQGAGASGFILKREELKIRFGLKSGVPAKQYGFEIDNKIIHDENDYRKYYKPLIDDGRKINDAVFGIINMNLVSAFSASNFIILGTNNKPSLKILNQEKMLSAFNPYASDNIFGLEITTNYNDANKQWDWSKAVQVWDGQKFETDLAKHGLTISTAKKAALRLVIKTNKYGVFGDSQNQLKSDQSAKQTSKAFQKLLDLSANIYITVEIENPFEKQSKTLAIKTRDENNKAKWKQGEGQFRIVVADQNGTPEANDQDAKAFMDASGVDNVDKLELIYKVFESKPSQGEIGFYQRPEVINNYNSQTGWQSFDFTTTNKNDKEWSKGLKLKVGNYLMVALRVKKQYADPKNNPHILKDEKHSVLIPVKGNENPGRVAGYLVDPKDIPVKKDSIHLESMKDNLSGYLDGYTQLKSLALEKDDKGTIEGINLKLQLYNDFYKGADDKILVAGSGAKLIKRITTGMEQGDQYKDKNGSLITDKDGKPVYAYFDNKTNPKRLSAPEENTNVTRSLQLATSGNGIFVVPIFTDLDRENEFSLFRNQKIEILYEAKQGEGTQALPDFELTGNKTSENLQDVISPQIKFAVENTQNIKYDWNYDEYADNVLKYESSTPGTTDTVSGFSKFKTPLKIKRTNGNDQTFITAATGAESAQKLEEMLKKDFNGQLQFSYTYIRKSGSESKYKNTANIYNEQHLENGDRVILTIEAVANDLIYTEAPKPLILNVKGLMTDAPEQDKLQFLRVEQSGVINGKGSFRLLVNDPLKPNEDNQSILKNWKFLLRVWDGKTDEKGEHKIKINWTEDQTKLVNLSNGDKVEWKLVDKNDNHVQDGYYNTVAGEHQSGPNGQVIFNFMQVNYPNGPEDKVVVSPGIGAYPAKEDENKYPEKSGFVIGGLQEKLTRFDLTQSAFEKIIRTLGPYYKGVDGHGVLNFNPKFFEGTWWVNHNGDVYQKEQNQPTTWADQIMDQPAEITLDQFFAHTTFYTKNPAVVPTQIGWQFASNDTALDNYLSNSNQLWARFDVMQPQANLEKSVHLKAPTSNDPAAFDGFLIAQLPAVANLKTVTDPMSPLWWVLISLGMLITFGTLFIIVWKQKYKKLKDPKI